MDAAAARPSPPERVSGSVVDGAPPARSGGGGVSTVRYGRLIPLWLDLDHQAEVDRFTELYFDAQDAGLDPVVSIETTPDGDRWVLEFENDAA